MSDIKTIGEVMNDVKNIGIWIGIPYTLLFVSLWLERGIARRTRADTLRNQHLDKPWYGTSTRWRIWL